MNEKQRAAINILFSMFLALGAGAVVILLQGESPVEAYAALLRGAFNGKLKFGTTLAGFTPLLLTSLAFIVAAKAGAFHCGIEGCVFLGGIVAAYIGINWTFLPGPIQLTACFIGAMLAAAIWSMIPGMLKIYFNVSEVCCTILMNSVALYITNYLVSGAMSAGTSLPQSANVNVKLSQFMKPSSANTGFFIAIIVTVFIMVLVYRTTFGFRLRLIGTNPLNAEYAGTDPKKMFISAMMLAGSIGGIAGAIEVLGVHGCFLNNFASGLGTNGMLAALICKNNMFAAPFISFFIAVLKSGAMGMQQATDVPKSLVDTITAVFIIFACMNLLGDIWKKRSNPKEGRNN